MQIILNLRPVWPFIVASVFALALSTASLSAQTDKPNILVLWGDDIGITNLSCYSDGLMGYDTPNIDQLAKEGLRFQ